MTITLRGIEKALSTLESASFASGSQRSRFVRKVAKKVLMRSKKHITAQTDLQGKPFKKRADGRRKKMLLKLRGEIKVVKANEHAAALGFISPTTSQIAYKHQHGHVEWVEVSHNRKSSSAKRDQPATRRQARALLEAGYKVRIKGKGYRRPSQRWIMDNMTIGRAGLILRLIRGTKQKWKITLPARSFLGITDEELEEIINEVVADEQKRIQG